MSDNDLPIPPIETPRPIRDRSGKFLPGYRRTGGRKKGVLDKVPRSFKASIKRIYEDLGKRKPGLYRKAIIAGLEAKPPISFPYVQLAAHYLDGKPKEQLEVEVTRRSFVIVLTSTEDPLQDAATKEIALPSSASGGEVFKR